MVFQKSLCLYLPIYVIFVLKYCSAYL